MLPEVQSSHAKAVKNDDATTETAMWDTACVEKFDAETHGPALAILRKYSVLRFVKNVKSSFARYLKSKYDFTWTQESEAALDKGSDLLKDLAAGRDGIDRASKSFSGPGMQGRHLSSGGGSLKCSGT